MKMLFSFAITVMLLSCAPVKPGNEEPVSLENTYWKLVELRGQPVASPVSSNKTYYLELKSNDHSMSAFAGCNGIGGNYTLLDGNRISFSNMISTMMACPELETENTFKKVLETVDNYSINGNMLSLNRAKMATLAKFERSAR